MLPVLAMLVAANGQAGPCIDCTPQTAARTRDMLGGMLAVVPRVPRQAAGRAGVDARSQGDGNPLDDILGMAGKLLR